MKIVVNARLLIKPYTGIAQFTKNIFLELATTDKVNEYVLVVPEKVDTASWGKLPSNLKMKVLKEKFLISKGLKKTYWEQLSFPKFAKSENADVIFHTYPANSWRGLGVKEIVTVHDCIPWVLKEYQRGGLSKLYHFLTKRALKKADLVLTVSASSKSEIIKVGRVPEWKMAVANNAASKVYKPEGDDDGVLEEFNLKRRKYFLYVGGYDERKNVSYLLSEFSDLNNCKFPLVLAGGKQFESSLYESFSGGNERVVKTGFIEEEKLASLYRNCIAFVNFSKYEGFNIPILEAANSGAPIILSDIDVHREVAGNAAMFVDLKKPGSGVAAMKCLLKDNERKAWAEKSLALAKKYSISDSVKKVKDLINI